MNRLVICFHVFGCRPHGTGSTSHGLPQRPVAQMSRVVHHHPAEQATLGYVSLASAPIP